MAERNRTTPWRQGAALHASQLRTSTRDPAFEWAVIVSHDCDIANDDLEREPFIEMVPAAALTEPDGNHQYARNPRELHLPLLDNAGGQMGWFRLDAPRKFMVEKASLVGVGTPGAQIHPDHHHTLQDWLATRYRRHALPDALVGRLRGVMSLLGKKLKSRGEQVIGLWLEYDPRDELESGDPYEIDLYVVHSAEASGAADAADALADAVRPRLACAPDIVVRQLLILSEQEFTLHDLRSAELLRFEHISNRLGPDAPRAD